MVREASGSWGVRWRENGKRRYKGGLASRDLAERLLAKIMGELAHFRAGMPADPQGFPPLSEEVEDWLTRRELTHRAWDTDRSRWKNHLGPFFGHLRPAEVDAGAIRAFIEHKLAARSNPATVGHFIRLLSTIYADLCERPGQTGATENPVRTLPRSTRRLMRPSHDPRRTPFLRRLLDVQRVYLALVDLGHASVAPAFALGAFGGLRTGEVLGITWPDVDLERLELDLHQQVHKGRIGPLKDDEARRAPIQDSLLPVLKAYRLASGGRGLLFQASRPGRRSGKNATPSRFMAPKTLHEALRAALARCELPVALTWYQCTRHTFASHWVISGGSIERLALILGHSSTEVTKRYAHLLPDHLGAEDRARLTVDLIGQQLGSEPIPIRPPSARKTKKRAALR